MPIASRAPTLRQLARRLRLSVATVSEALRDIPRVSATTRARVQRAAAQAGYERNALLGAALSAVRRARHRHYRGTLALIDTDDANHAQYVLFHQAIVAGAEERAQELGFQTELFWIGSRAPALPLTRLPGILHARGIGGAVLLPFNAAQDFGDFDFKRLAAVQMDHCLLRPRLHTVMPDHYLSMHGALTQLAARGYRNPGLCLEERKDTRVKNKWSAAFHSFHGGRAPALVAPKIGRAEFLAWFARHRPDAIVAHRQEIMDWLASAGFAVPTQVGFFNLNLTERLAPCAGLDLGPQRLGAAAIETVVAMLHRHERGVPTHPYTIALEAVWHDGPTLRDGATAAPANTPP
ncbi:MAG: LacI family DNA-binding transcriptional regulator [Opitutaceae bacterium]|nr:LacI family DNA-binding transcriptional regulator [Opitutaceae bacterium]